VGYKAMMLQLLPASSKVHEDLEKFVIAKARARQDDFAQVALQSRHHQLQLGHRGRSPPARQVRQKPLTGEQIRWGFENLDLRGPDQELAPEGC